MRCVVDFVTPLCSRTLVCVHSGGVKDINIFMHRNGFVEFRALILGFYCNELY